MVANTLQDWAIRDVGDRPHKLFLHFFESPTEILGEDGKVVGLRTERTELDGTGNVRGTGKFNDWDVQAVYRAVGYLSRQPARAAVRRRRPAPSPTRPAGSSTRAASTMTGTYVTGWIKRGPVGLIGHTKGDANETVDCLLDDCTPNFAGAAEPGEDADHRVPRRQERPLHHLGRLVPPRRARARPRCAPRAASASRSSSATTCCAPASRTRPDARRHPAEGSLHRAVSA